MDAAAPTPSPGPAPAGGSAWRGRTLGGVWLFLLCAQLLRVVGLRGAWLGSWVIAGGFFVAGGRRQYASRSYWRRVRPDLGPLRRWWWYWRRYASFGRILCDRQLAWLDHRRFRFTSRGDAHDQTMRLIAGSEGCILLAAHIGNWELSGHMLHGMTGTKLHMVMVRDDHPAVQRFTDRRMRPHGIEVIDPRDGLGAALSIYSALSSGGTVCMLGDRVVPGQPTIAAEFLGGTARFPLGPFHAAAVTGRPILPAFLVKEGLRTYVLEVDEPYHIVLPDRRGDRAAVLAAAVQRWARRLEDQVRRYPLQWHNFYDFWA